MRRRLPGSEDADFLHDRYRSAIQRWPAALRLHADLWGVATMFGFHIMFAAQYGGDFPERSFPHFAGFAFSAVAGSVSLRVFPPIDALALMMAPRRLSRNAAKLPHPSE